MWSTGKTLTTHVSVQLPVTEWGWGLVGADLTVWPAATCKQLATACALKTPCRCGGL